jgi:hypothetical protein
MTPPSGLPASLPATRDALHRLACFVLAPARFRSTGNISLRPSGGGVGTPPLADGRRVEVRRGDLLVHAGPRRRWHRLSTLRRAAQFVDVDLDPRPPVGSDLPLFEPDAPLAIDPAAMDLIGRWYALGDRALQRLTLPAGSSVSASQLWPEHMDLAVVVTLSSGTDVNVGVSPGDSFSGEPYAYVGPSDPTEIHGSFWNAPFGALRPYTELVVGCDPLAALVDFADEGLAEATRLARRAVA